MQACNLFPIRRCWHPTADQSVTNPSITAASTSMTDQVWIPTLPLNVVTFSVAESILAYQFLFITGHWDVTLKSSMSNTLSGSMNSSSEICSQFILFSFINLTTEFTQATRIQPWIDWDPNPYVVIASLGWRKSGYELWAKTLLTLET